MKVIKQVQFKGVWEADQCKRCAGVLKEGLYWFAESSRFYY
jgi:hypothetical protein